MQKLFSAKEKRVMRFVLIALVALVVGLNLWYWLR